MHINTNYGFHLIPPPQHEFFAPKQPQDQFQSDGSWLPVADVRLPFQNGVTYRRPVEVNPCQGDNWTMVGYDDEIFEGDEILVKGFRWQKANASVGDAPKDCSDDVLAVRRRVPPAAEPPPRVQATTREWVRCPICNEPDMRMETTAGGESLIFCVNHGCKSNGGTVAAAKEPRYCGEWVAFLDEFPPDIGGEVRCLGEDGVIHSFYDRSTWDSTGTIKYWLRLHPFPPQPPNPDAVAYESALKQSSDMVATGDNRECFVFRTGWDAALAYARGVK